MTVATKLTDEEFLALPEEPGKQELLDGELITAPPPEQDDNDIAKRLFLFLLKSLDASRVQFEAGYKLRARRWLQPDVSVIWPDQKRGRWYEGAPMLAVEVVSPGNTDDEIDMKVQAFLENGAQEVWVVRPKTSSMTVFRKGDPAAVRYTGVYRYGPASLDIDVAALVRGGK